MKTRIISYAAAVIAVSCSLTTVASAEFLNPTGVSTTINVNADGVYDDNGEAWIKIANPYNENTIFTIGEVDAGTKDIIISFDVENCDGSYNARAGFGINDWTPSAWGAEDYEKIGGIPEFVIDHDGSYELIVPLSEVMKVTTFEDEETGEDFYKEYLEKIDCLELCISGVNASTTMVITINDVIQSPDAHTFAECELTASAPMDTATDTNTSADTTPSNEKGSPNTGIEGIAPVAGVALIAATAMFAVRKKRST